MMWEIKLGVVPTMMIYAVGMSVVSVVVVWAWRYVFG